MKDNILPFKAAETTKVRSTTVHNEFSVDRQLINSKNYHDLFLQLKFSPPVSESIYQCAMAILSHRNGTNFEDLYAIDARPGKLLAKNSSSTTPLRTFFNRQNFTTLLKQPNPVILIHNHPNSTRPSITDIMTLANYPFIAASVIVGHDATLQIIRMRFQKSKLEAMFNVWYTNYKKIGFPKQEAILLATDHLYLKEAVYFEEHHP